MISTPKTLALIIGLLGTFATTNSHAAGKTFADLKVGEEALIWPDDFCFDPITEKGVVPAEGNVAVAANHTIRTGANPDGPYAIIRSVEGGRYVEPQTSDGSTDSEEGFKAYLAFTRGVTGRADCLEPDGALSFVFRIVGN